MGQSGAKAPDRNRGRSPTSHPPREAAYEQTALPKQPNLPNQAAPQIARSDQNNPTQTSIVSVTSILPRVAFE
ncbi:hypothetical protein LMG3481_01172 [Achromobacter deleyi]|nr:hypothetical protein LMG3481_01172 [Achromobacter deleyi]